MTNYRVEQARLRLVVSSVLMVVAFCLHWSGVMELAGISNDAANRVIAWNYDLVISEAVMVGLAGKLQSDWMYLLGKSALTYAGLFGILAWIAWGALPRRVMTGVAAVGMFSTFALGLPFLPADMTVRAYTGHEFLHYVGGAARLENPDVTFPLSGVLPFFGIEAIAQEVAGAQVLQDGESGASGDADPSIHDPLVVAFLVANQVLNVLIGIGFWSAFLGLVYLTFARSRAEKLGASR